MLSKVRIENYRGFKSYEMQGLSRVNLFVGKNNSGKTALMEGIQFLTSAADPAVLVEVAERRGELIVSRPESSSTTIDISHFFHGHILAPKVAFKITGDNGYTPVSVEPILKKKNSESRTEQPSEGFYLYIQRKDDRVKEEKRDEERRESPPLFPISRDGGVNFDVARGFRRVGLRRSPGPHARFVGPDSLNTLEMAIMWDEVTVSGQEVDVAEAMRVLEPRLASVHFLTGMLASGYSPSRAGIVVGFSGQDGRLPLGSMGDGMRRMMAIATALAFTKNGCLFVDEIDTGLHYSVMQDMWKLVISKAISSNTQVFATTHSWDCIDGLARLCEQDNDLLDSVAIHKIDRNVPYSIAFAGDTLISMAKADIDPR